MDKRRDLDGIPLAVLPSSSRGGLVRSGQLSRNGVVRRKGAAKYLARERETLALMRLAEKSRFQR